MDSWIKQEQGRRGWVLPTHNQVFTHKGTYTRTRSQERLVTIPKEVVIEGQRERLSKVIPVELFRGEKLDCEYYEKQVAKMNEEIIKN